MVTGTLNAQKYQDEILESGVRSPLDSLDLDLLHEWDRISCLERMYPVNLMIKIMCHAVIGSVNINRK